MSWQDIRERALRLAGLLRRNRAEREMAEELEFHLAMRREKYAGESREAAAAHARRDLGSVAKWKDVCRDVGRSRPVEDFVRDLALAARMLRKTPAFTAVALATLALAIGTNTALFSLINALMLRQLPVSHPERLAILRVQPGEFGYSFNYPLFQYEARHAKVFSHVFACVGRNLQARGANGVELIATELVSGQYFDALSVRPEIGRFILPADDRPGTPDGLIAVISHRLWQSRYGSSPAVLGRKIVLADVVFTIVGVMPPGFRSLEADNRDDVYLPFEAEPAIDAPFSNIAAGYNTWWFRVGARLRDGVSLEQANAFLRATAHATFAAVAPDPKSRFDGYLLSDLYLTAEPGIRRCWPGASSAGPIRTRAATSSF